MALDTRRWRNGPPPTIRRFEEAVDEFLSQQELGYIGTVPDGPGKARHVRRLPREADLVIMRRPIAGG
jgi:hypothetical protein